MVTNRMHGFERMVRRNMRPLFEHVTLVYPAVDPVATIGAVLDEAEQQWASAPRPGRAHQTDWLFALAHAVAIRPDDDQPFTANAEAIVGSYRAAAAETSDWHVFDDVERVIVALQTLAPSDQVVLRLLTSLGDGRPDRVATILEITIAEAQQLIDRVQGSFRAAFENASAVGTGDGGER